jgi:hypothetical protein
VYDTSYRRPLQLAALRIVGLDAIVVPTRTWVRKARQAHAGEVTMTRDKGARRLRPYAGGFCASARSDTRPGRAENQPKDGRVV